MFENIIKIININNIIGEFAPYISFLLGFIFLYRSKKQRNYILFFLSSFLLNVILKLVWRENRPFGPHYPQCYSKYYDYDYDLSHIKNNISSIKTRIIRRIKRIINVFNQYGMPSGHSQTMAFLTVYTYLNTYSLPLLIVNLFLTYSTIIQRIETNKHTEKQVNIGLIIGSLFGLFV